MTLKGAKKFSLNLAKLIFCFMLFAEVLVLKLHVSRGSTMSKAKDGAKKQIISIFVYTSFDAGDCREKIVKCLSGLDLPKNLVVLSFEKRDTLILNGKYTTLVQVMGDSRGGWGPSGMKSICECLEKSGYITQFINASHSVVPF